MTSPTSGTIIDQFYDYCDSTRPGGNGEWTVYEPGLAFKLSASFERDDGRKQRESLNSTRFKAR